VDSKSPKSNQSQTNNIMSNTNITTTTEETATFELVQRQAKLLASSTLVPKEFQGNMSNCAIGLNIAKRLGADAFMVIQNIDIIHGRPSFRGKFLIAMVNASGRFSPLKFKFDGQGDNYGCTAYATDKESGDIIEGPKVDWNMVKGEGWHSKAGSKWKTMPELMFRYRAGAYFANIYAPDITLGMMTSEELTDLPPEPRIATGRVVEGTQAKLANPYEEAPATFEDLPPVAPQPTGEAPLASPVEVSEQTERAQLIDEIKDCCAENELTMATFGGKAKSLDFMAAKDTMRDMPIDDLREIHANRLAIAQGTYKAGGEA
jgi:hypothetical protein